MHHSMLVVETLEPRMLLNADVKSLLAPDARGDAELIDTPTADSLVAGLDLVDNWVTQIGDVIGGFSDFEMPFLGSSVDDLISMGQDFGADLQAILTTIRTTTSDFLDANPGSTTDLLAAFITANVDGVTVTDTSPDATTYQFDVGVTLAEVNKQFPIDLIEQIENQIDGFTISGVSAEALANLTADATFNFTVGVDDVGNANDFFLRDPNIALEFAASANFTMGIDFGIFEAELVNATFNFATAYVIDKPPALPDLTFRSDDLQSDGSGNYNYGSLTSTYGSHSGGGGGSSFDFSLPISIPAFGSIFGDLSLPSFTGSSSVPAGEPAGTTGESSALFSNVNYTLPDLSLPEFSDLVNFEDLSFNQLLDNIVSGLNFLFDSGDDSHSGDNPDGIAFKNLPIVNQSLNDLLSIDLAFLEGLGIDLGDLSVQLNAFPNISGIDLTTNSTVPFNVAFEATVEGIRQLGTGLQTLEGIFNDLLNFDGGPVEQRLTLTFDTNSPSPDFDNVLVLDFSFGHELLSEQIDFGMDLADLAALLGGNPFGDVGPLTVSGGGNINLDASATLDLGLGFGFNGLATPTPYVTDASGVTFAFAAVGQNLNMEATVDVPLLGPVGMTIKNGQAALDADGDAGTPDPATVFLGLNEDATDHLYRLSELTNTASYGYAITAGLGIDLPMYFPTESLPMGGSDQDNNNDGIPDNVMQVRSDLGQNGLTNIQVVTPKLGNQFNIFNIFNNPELFVDAFDGVLTALQDGLNGGIFDITLPIIGKISDTTAAQAATQFMADIQSSIIGTYDDPDTPQNEGSGLKGLVQGKTTVEVVQEVIFNLLGPGQAFGTPGLNILVDESNQKIDDPSDVMLEITEDHVQFNIRMADTLASFIVPLSFDAGISGLKLDVDTEILIEMNYVMEFGLGVDFNNLEFYFDTSGATASGAEMALTLDAVLAPSARVERDNNGDVVDFPLEGQLAFLQLAVGDDDDYDPANWRTDGLGERPSGVFGEFALDLLDPDGSNADGERLTISEIQSHTLKQIVEARFNAEADVDLVASVTIPTYTFHIGSASFDLQFPELSTTVHYDQVFVDASTNADADTFGGKPIVTFEDVTLDLGEFITAFISPIIEQVHQVTEPIEPVAELLQQEIGLLKQLGSPATSLLDIAEVALGQTKYAPVVKAIEAIVEVVGFIDTVSDFVDSGADSILIKFGTFTIGDGVGDDLRGSDAANIPAPAPSSGSLDLDRDINNSGGNSGQKQATKEIIKKIGTEPGSFQFPILTNPSSAIGILMGKTVDLFKYDMPALDLNFKYVRSFPIFVGLNARFGGGVTARTNFTFGYDTRGIQAWADGGYNTSPSEIVKIFDGFFIDDHVTFNSPGNPNSGIASDEDEVTLSATIVAGASVGISGLVEAGVEGGIDATIGFNLNDLPEPGTGEGTPNPAVYDGKIRAEELVKRLEQGIECIFDTHGELTAFLDAFFWVGLDLGFFGEITIFEARKRFINETLASFEHHCPDPDPPVIATRSNGVVTLHYQPAEGMADQGERYFVDRMDVPIDPAHPEMGMKNVIRVSSRGFVEDYDPNTVTKIVAFGTGFDDEFVIGENLTADVEIHGGGGNDLIEVQLADPAYSVQLFGDEGNDILMGGPGDDLLVGGSGKDVIGGGPGNDVIFGDDQDSSSTVSLADGADEPVRQLHDQIAGGDGDDEIHGGIGNDLILGEAGNDTIFGDGGLDEISGGDDNDVIHGGDGDDILKGDEGTDTIFGEKGNDTITGGLNADTMIGGPGADTFQWAYGDGNDVSVIGGSSLAQDPDSGGFFEETDTYAVSHEAVFDDTVTVTPSEPDNVRFEFSGSDNLLVGIERLSIEVGEGADDVVVHSLINTTVTDVDIDFGISENEIILEEPLVYTAADFNDPNDPLIGTPVLDGEGNPIMAQLITVESAKDARRDRLHLYGTPGNDAYDIGTPEDPLNPDIGESIFINHTVIGLDRNTTYSITNSENTLDELIVEARPLQGATSNGLAGANGAPATGDGQDRIDAFQVTKDLAEWTFITGTEDDTITATPFADVIDSGSGNDTVTGGLGVDLFFDADGQDTLIEMRDEADLVFRLSDTQLQAGTEIENLHHLFEMVRLVALNNSNAPGEIHEDDEVTIGELSLPLFKIGIPDPNESLYDNEFYVSNWTGRAELDGGEGADLYVIELSGEGDPSVTALVDITDTGTKGLDRVEILGTDEVDTFAFRADVIERIVFADQGGFSRVVEFNTDITTRDSSSAAGFRQAVNYLSVENIYVKGGDGNDLFVVDDTSSEVFLYGEGGEDLFFVGNVISTKEFEDPRLGIIDIVDEITNGVTFPAVVHGGEGDDYFEVNHNVAPIALFGENGDDIFFLRAHLTTEPGTNKTMATSGAEMHVTTQEDEQDVLSYVKNAPVKIHGGAGFDTLAIVGTAADDTFTIFVEEEDGKLVQRIFGAGLIVPEIEEIEQLVIVTGGGDDSVFVYGLLPNQNIRINTGSDNDTVYLGGQEVSFDVIIPEFQRTVTKVIPAYREETVTEVLRPAYTYPKVTYPHHILGITLPIPVIELVHVPASTRTRTIQVRDPENDQVIPEVITVPEQVIPVTMPETRELTSLQGIVTIESLGAEFGSNTLIVNNQYALAENSIGVMTTDRDSLGYLHGLGMGDNGVVFENFDHVEVNLGDHDDRFTIEATLEETTTVVDGGGGNDAFFMGDIVDLIDTNPILADRAWGRNRLQQSEGAVTFHGGAGINVLNLSDADDGRSNKGLITGGLVSLLGLARNQENLGVRYTRMSELNLTLGDGSNELVIESTHGLATTVVSGSGNDTISVLAVSGNTTIQTGSGDDIVQVGSIHPELGGTLAEIKASLFIDTGLDDGTDRLVVDDSGDETFNEGQLHSDAILGLGIVGELRFANIEDMQVHLGSGGNLFAVAGTTTGTTRILGHVGQEEIQVRQIDGPTTIETGDGNDTIRVGAGSHDDVSTLNGINAGLT